MVLTLCYLLTKWFIFKGFNGTDDLHYGMLAAKMLKGGFDPFQPGDIFSGRILLIASQALVYKVAGINIISTQAGSVIMLLLSCYLTVFRLLPVKSLPNTFLACCLFYFNPLITALTFEIGGDIYILLAGIILCIILKSWIQTEKSLWHNIKAGGLMALIVAITLLYKETVLVFLPCIVIAAFLYNSINAWSLALSFTGMFAFVIMLYGFAYYHFTGDALFRITQIKNSSYPNHCSYDLLPVRELVIRLTYGVFQEFIVRGFYPVVFACIISVSSIFSIRKLLEKQHMLIVFFSILLVSSLYLPFSFHGYQPLCSDARQFLFLLPLGVLVTTMFIVNYTTGRYTIAISLLLVLVVCVFSTGNKWEWMIYLLLLCCFGLSVITKKFAKILIGVCFPLILWLSILEHRFFKNSNWFTDMIALNKMISSAYYYFPDHDNMMHWQLLHQFNQESFVYYNLYKHPFKVYNLYYRHLQNGVFHPGWFIINKANNVRQPELIQKLNSPEQPGHAIKKVSVGDMSAYYIDNPVQLSYIQSLMDMYE